jgi:hypothetical protein
MPGPQLVGARAGREVEQGVESERAVAARAGVGSLSGTVRRDERRDHRVAELFPEIERHVR